MIPKQSYLITDQGAYKMTSERVDIPNNMILQELGLAGTIVPCADIWVSYASKTKETIFSTKLPKLTISGDFELLESTPEHQKVRFQFMLDPNNPTFTGQIEFIPPPWTTLLAYWARGTHDFHLSLVTRTTDGVNIKIPPLPNMYEDSKMCLGDARFDMSMGIDSIKDIIDTVLNESAWNQDLNLRGTLSQTEMANRWLTATIRNTETPSIPTFGVPREVSNSTLLTASNTLVTQMLNCEHPLLVDPNNTI